MVEICKGQFEFFRSRLFSLSQLLVGGLNFDVMAWDDRKNELHNKDSRFGSLHPVFLVPTSKLLISVATAIWPPSIVLRIQKKLNRDVVENRTPFMVRCGLFACTLAWIIYDPWKASTVCAMMNYGMSRRGWEPLRSKTWRNSMLLTWRTNFKRDNIITV